MDYNPSAQAVLAFDFGHLRDSTGRDLLFVPVWATVLSALILLFHWVVASKVVSRLLVRMGLVDERADTVPHPGIGKGTILVFRVARVLGCLVLLTLSITPMLHEREGLARGLLLSVPYLYALVLAALSASPKESRHRLIGHVNCVLFLTFCVYSYRDVLPLATFTGVPADLDEGPTLWAKIAVLFITAVMIPLFTPRQYIPVDPSNPAKAVNPEQTASIFSFALYFFLDHIIFLAHRQSRLDEDELYPLCDTDASTHLKNQSFKFLDRFSGKKSQHHIFVGFMRFFRREVTLMVVLILLKVVTTISGQVPFPRIYIETQGQEADVRPWAWILIIFLAPVVGLIGDQLSAFINTRSLVRADAIITQLVFAHRLLTVPSLRIRMKAETTATDAPAVEGSLSDIPPASTASSTRTPTPQNPEGPRSTNVSPTLQGSASSVKSASAKPPPQPVKPETKKPEGSLVGKINNLVTVDLANIVEGWESLQLLVSIPLQVAASIWFIHSLLGWSVWVGVASIILLAPVPGHMAKLVQSMQQERLKRTDERVQSVSEAVNVLRMVKLFGWEEKMKARIAEKRDAELVWIRKKRVLDMVAGFVKYTLVMGQPLNASKVFSTMTVFDLLRLLTYNVSDAVTGKVSLDRVDEFLNKTELLDVFDEKETPLPTADTSSDERIGFRNATFSWSKQYDGSLTPSHRQFLLKIDGELLFQRGRINLVVGPTGSGKTSLLMALLAQESWVLNETIRSNIVFDSPFDEERYKKVLYQCALEPDIALFQAGDQSEVGEKGLTLSGGQKARLTLARAVYSKASILLLDDVLAALDVHTALWIVEKCFGGDLIENRTVILVTHNIALARPIADFVVTFGSDGRVRSQGSISELTKRGPLSAQIRKEQQALDKAGEEIDAEDPIAKPVDGQLILAEEVQLGHVGTSALKMYFFAIAGKYPFFFFAVFFVGLFSVQILTIMRTWMLGYWAKQYDQRPPEEVNVILYVFAIVLISNATGCVIFIYLVFGQLRASKVIHINLITSVLSAPLRWLDVTPASRILARVTNDMRAVDDSLAGQCYPIAFMAASMLFRFGAVLLYAPIFVFPGAIVGVVGAWIGQIYISAQLPVKRLMSNTRAPVLAHFGAAISGLVSIRAFGAQSKFSSESLARIDRFTRAARNQYNLNRWISVRIDLLGATFSAGLATYLVYVKHTDAGDSGFLLNMAISFTLLLTDVHKSGNSLERIQGYIDIEHEKPPTEAGNPPAYWPANGDLRVEGLSARYSEDGPKVLHDISFHITSGERVGIVGRTGSGKSSLTLSLLRCIPTEGSVIYDGLETSKLNLDALRSSITIIPQIPELLSGTLRANLDPFGQYDDAELNDSLRAAGLFALQDEMDEGRITLDSAISTGGSNLSIGQRQIFALARAILRRSKILILDEDYKTDSIIQNSLRHELRGDVSLITVAHRLQTIMDADKIMVLDAGCIVEFDSPKKLLKMKDGKLRALVEESGDRDALYAMAGAD
ncbi:P-loop containing nucleoside triphosphate hydrolase protein [Mycena polygramma]|nr:P-loop containing nucleoside triphosphate hydrolase protein [Mycena polygramma]